MSKQERKEILQINGVTMMFVMLLLGNFLVVGFFYRWNTHEVYIIKKQHNNHMTDLLRVQHDLHLEIVQLEGVDSWVNTQYMKTISITPQ